MKLIFLYGLPGSGELTIAKEMTKILGDEFKLFHNQMTVDIISPIFPFASPKWLQLNSEYRRLMFEACAEEDVNLITTFVFAKGDDGDENYISGIIELVEKYEGQTHFVHLVCDEEIVFERIKNPDRKKHRKVSDPEKLKQSMKRWNLVSPIPFVENFTVNTGELSAEESAKAIINHYKMK